jgi:hypothetical protein
MTPIGYDIFNINITYSDQGFSEFVITWTPKAINKFKLPTSLQVDKKCKSACFFFQVPIRRMGTAEPKSMHKFSASRISCKIFLNNHENHLEIFRRLQQHFSKAPVSELIW